MLTTLIINQVDFTPWILPGGLVQTEIWRCGKSLVSMDGTEHRAGVKKRGLQVRLVTLRDDVLHSLHAALTSPCAVTWTDLDGTERSAQFYVSGITAAGKLMRAGVTWWDGFGFTLEQR